MKTILEMIREKFQVNECGGSGCGQSFSTREHNHRKPRRSCGSGGC